MIASDAMNSPVSSVYVLMAIVDWKLRPSSKGIVERRWHGKCDVLRIASVESVGRERGRGRKGEVTEWLENPCPNLGFGGILRAMRSFEEYIITTQSYHQRPKWILYSIHFPQTTILFSLIIKISTLSLNMVSGFKVLNPFKLAYVVLYATKFKEQIESYQKFIGASIVHEEYHRIAIINIRQI